MGKNGGPATGEPEEYTGRADQVEDGARVVDGGVDCGWKDQNQETQEFHDGFSCGSQVSSFSNSEDLSSFANRPSFILIFASWWWPTYYYLYLPFISFPLVLNCIMIASIIAFQIRNLFRPEKVNLPSSPEAMVMVMPCYNETHDECSRSLDSLVNQAGVERHKRAILVICDGKARGPGMEKTTADILLEDIFVEPHHREDIKEAYTAWDGVMMDVEISRGLYKGVPYLCIVKQQNQGKRDSLIVVRSFLHKFNTREKKPNHIFSQRFFNTMTRWMETGAAIMHVDCLVGMDADTIFDKNCISELIKESHYPNTVGVCGYVAVDFRRSFWTPWAIYQSAEYTIAQGLRRLHQSIATKKVSCLPGCCQLLLVSETTCGDHVLVDLFGYHPKHVDGLLKRIRATASEDRNHVCLMLTEHPKAQTRQALRAKAYTDVPQSWAVFLSQRRRWSLGATSNDLLLLLHRNTQWFERILAFSNVMTWCLNVFVIASVGCMIVAFISQPWWIIVAFASVMIIPYIYYIIIAIWLPHGIRERAQYLVGLLAFTFVGPFISVAVMVFSVWNMDSFGWGKTRMVIAEAQAVETDVEKKKVLENLLGQREKRPSRPLSIGPLAFGGAGRARSIHDSSSEMENESHLSCERRRLGGFWDEDTQAWSHSKDKTEGSAF